MPAEEQVVLSEESPESAQVAPRPAHSTPSAAARAAAQRIHSSRSSVLLLFEHNYIRGISLIDKFEISIIFNLDWQLGKL